jgi:ATP-dependent RNA helicase DeaD
MHGDLNQAARERVLRSLRNGKLDVLVATDVAARGLDVDLLSHVVNLDLPRSAETYVHRIGRTGRAGRKGTAITFVTPREQGKLQWLQKQLGKPIENIAVPSDLDIARRRRSELAEALNAVGPEDEDAHAWLAHLLEQDGSDVHAIAAAALRLIADADRVPLTRDLNPKPPRWAKPPRTQQRNERPLRPHQRDRGDFTRDERQREPRGHRDQHVELFFPIGRRHGLRPQDVVGALTRELGVPGHLIGRVTIVEFKTFVGLPAAVAHDVLKAKNIILRGRDLRLVLARPSGRR